MTSPSPPPIAILPTLPSVPASAHKLNPYVLSPSVVFIIGAIGSIFLVIGYYQIMLKYCTSLEVVLTRRRNNNNSSSSRNGAASQRLAVEATRLEGVPSCGLDPSLIDRIPITKYTNKDGAASATECSVCLTDFSEGEAVRLLPRCEHLFHIACIGMWLHNHSNCPLCRADVLMGFIQFFNSEKNGGEHSEASGNRAPGFEVETQETNNAVMSIPGTTSVTDLGREGGTSSHWHVRRFIWCKRASSPPQVRVLQGLAPAHEVVIELGGPSHETNNGNAGFNGGGQSRDER